MSDSADFLGPDTERILSLTGASRVELLHDWAQLGGETFSADFLLHLPESDVHLFAKACIKYFPIETVDEWLVRRRVLEENGVTVPKLYARDRAVIIEEFIPYSLIEAFSIADEAGKEILRQAFVDTYKRVTSAGFGPFSLHDARSHGENVVLVDMGEDIGSPRPASSYRLDIAKHALVAFARITHTESERQ
jgi:hypothetical protein